MTPLYKEIKFWVAYSQCFWGMKCILRWRDGCRNMPESYFWCCIFRIGPNLLVVALNRGINWSGNSFKNCVSCGERYTQQSSAGHRHVYDFCEFCLPGGVILAMVYKNRLFGRWILFYLWSLVNRKNICPGTDSHEVIPRWKIV